MAYNYCSLCNLTARATFFIFYLHRILTDLRQEHGKDGDTSDEEDLLICEFVIKKVERGGGDKRSAENI